MPSSTPIAVSGEGSPDPPCSTGIPVTQGVSRLSHCISRGDVPTSSAAM